MYICIACAFFYFAHSCKGGEYFKLTSELEIPKTDIISQEEETTVSACSMKCINYVGEKKCCAVGFLKHHLENAKPFVTCFLLFTRIYKKYQSSTIVADSTELFKLQTIVRDMIKMIFFYFQ